MTHFRVVIAATNGTRLCDARLPFSLQGWDVETLAHCPYKGINSDIVTSQLEVHVHIHKRTKCPPM